MGQTVRHLDWRWQTAPNENAPDSCDTVYEIFDLGTPQFGKADLVGFAVRTYAPATAGVVHDLSCCHDLFGLLKFHVVPYGL